MYVISWGTLKVLGIGTTTPSKKAIKNLVRPCCYGCDLRTGILLIGIFGLFSLGHDGTYSTFHAYQTLADIENEGISTTEELSVFL